MLECVKCGTTQNLISHDFTYDLLPVLSKSRLWYRKYSIFKSRLRESLHSVPVSVCERCKKEFDRWILIENIINFMGSIEIALLFLFGILFLIIVNVNIPFFQLEPWIASPIILLILNSIWLFLLVVTIIFYCLHRSKNTNPRKYIKIGSDIVPLVKPHNYPVWINYNDWLTALSPKSEQISKVISDAHNQFSKFETLIYQFLKTNSGKAFTNLAIIKRIIEKIPNESEQEFLKLHSEEILNQMSLRNQINVVIKHGKAYYLIE